MNRIAFLIAAVCALLFMIVYDLYAAFLLGLILLITPILGIAAAFYAKNRIKVSLHHPERAEREKEIGVTLSLAGPFLSFLNVSARSKDYALSASSDSDFLFSFPVPHCGQILLEDFELIISDPFRLVRFHLPIPSSSVLVMPRLAGNFQDALHAFLSNPSLEEKEHFGATEYRPGDSMKLVNWKVSARKEELYIRDSYPASSGELAIAADYSAKENDRDLIGDALLTGGMALLSAGKPFTFLWRAENGTSVSSLIRTKEEWISALSSFLSAGGHHALQDARVPSGLPTCYLTDSLSPFIPAHLHPRLWCTDERNSQADIAGKIGFTRALGGAR